MDLSQFTARHGGSATANRAAMAREAAMNGETLFQPEFAAQLGVPTYVLYIYNVGPMEHRVAKGSAGPPGGYFIKPCEKGKPYSEPLLIPSMVTDTYLQEDIAKTHTVTGEFMCNDIVHPALTDTSWSVGQNLDDFGVFWTKHKVPMPEELALAVAKMERVFRAALAEANMLEAIGRLDLITPLMRHAADHFEESRGWNRIYKRMLECPVCGESMKAEIAVHKCGAVINWSKAIFHGVKSYDDAKHLGMYTEQLEKQVEELRYLASKPKQTAVDEPSGSFLKSDELEEYEHELLDVVSPPQGQAAKVAAPSPEQLNKARETRAKHGKKPPTPKKAPSAPTKA